MYTLGTNMHHLEVNEVVNCPNDTVALNLFFFFECNG